MVFHHPSEVHDETEEVWPRVQLEVVKLVRERGVAVAQAARDLDLHEIVLRKSVKELAVEPGRAFPGRGR